LGALIALFTVSERYPRRYSIWAPLVSWVAVGGVIIYHTGFPAGLGGLVQVGVSTSVAWVLGTWSRERRAHADLAEARAIAAERQKDEDARRAVAEERQRIARELHDVVTHHVSVMVIQAEAAASALTSRPPEAAKSVASIAATGRQALADMRTMLGVLGPVAGSQDETNGAAEPMPSLDRLGELIESLRAAGLSVELSVTGQRRRLHPGIELSAYRIIQEALTNTLKHARGARARVSVHFGEADVTVAVADEGGGRATEAAERGAGRGLVGMRERVAMFGGDFSAQPTDGGFRIEARLPLVLEPVG
jgi:signal transduction histidine kinase